MVDGVVVRCACVELRAAVFRDQPVELIRDHIICRADAELVDLHLDFLPPFTIFRGGQLLVFPLDGVKEDLFGLVIDRPDPVGAFEHHVFEVVRDARVGRVLRSGQHDDSAEDFRLAVVFVEPHREAIVQDVLLNFC